METAGLPNWSKVSLASVITPPLNGAASSLLPFNAYNSKVSASLPVFSSLVKVGFPHTNFANLLSAGIKERISALLK